jgi:hypothetical protein
VDSALASAANEQPLLVEVVIDADAWRGIQRIVSTVPSATVLTTCSLVGGMYVDRSTPLPCINSTVVLGLQYPM